MSDTKMTETKEAPKQAEAEDIATPFPATSQDWKEGDPTPSEIAETERQKAQAEADKAAKATTKESASKE